MLINRNKVVDICANIRQSGKKIIFTNGCFDSCIVLIGDFYAN